MKRIALGRIPELDSIRAIATVCVMILHYFHTGILAILPSALPAGAPALDLSQHVKLEDTLAWCAQHHVSLGPLTDLGPLVFGFWDLGKLGVFLFFLVSGFIIPYSFRTHHAEGEDAAYPVLGFLVSRVFRLYPMYWVSLALLVAFGYAAGPVTVKALVSNVTMFQRFWGVPDLNGVTWTLQIEWLFYGLCMMLFGLGALGSKKVNYGAIGVCWVLALLVAYLRMAHGNPLSIVMPLGVSLMFMGQVWRMRCLPPEAVPAARQAAGHYQDGPVARWEIAVLLVAFACVLLPTAWMFYGAGGMWTYVSTYAGALVAFGLLTTQWRVAHPALVGLGRISYSVYLLQALGHPVVAKLVSLNPRIYAEYPLLALGPMLAAMAAVAGLATLSYHCVEKPCIRAGKKVMQKIYELPSRRIEVLVNK